MRGVNIEEAISLVCETDPRFEADAYRFLRDALDHTITSLKKPKSGAGRHVSGRELAEGFRDLALREFGPMALLVLSRWGLRRTEDIGALVFNLVEAGVLGASENDSPDDFSGGFDFESAFRFPFLPPARTRRASGACSKKGPSR
jgi:uncharacterized repeat protein (TIGR04138 family)